LSAYVIGSSPVAPEKFKITRDKNMICKPEDAGLFDCCIMLKKCTGKECMAWKDYYVHGEHKYKPDGFVPRPPPEKIKTDKGYCGYI
jgi:hypothetical protein